jgi:hypothetical protein
MNNITFGDNEFGHYETVAGGAGAVSFFTLICLAQLFLQRKKRKILFPFANFNLDHDFIVFILGQNNPLDKTFL